MTKILWIQVVQKDVIFDYFHRRTDDFVYSSTTFCIPLLPHVIFNAKLG